jgi:hypothetical protein
MHRDAGNLAMTTYMIFALASMEGDRGRHVRSMRLYGAAEILRELYANMPPADAIMMGDPVGAAAHARASLAPNGTVLIVEPKAGDRVEDNVGPVGRTFYAGSTFLCTPNALAQHGTHTLGAQAGPARLGDVLRRAGFTRVRTTVTTPFNLVLEARP